ncbi:MAG: hypothetical protein K9H26_12840 [Prolixibacteraceae bacterium]|nr:hypothetical protein [Prolixibacteraceae bacterium]
MSWLSQQYKNNINGIIITLAFHILVFIVLNITQFRKKFEYHEPEIIIEFPTELLQTEMEPNNQQEEAQVSSSSVSRTNVAANRATPKRNDFFDENYQEELNKAQQLVNDVSKQLSKEIPTVDDLQMPVETSEGIDIDSLKNKLYSGDSNVEYYLEDRFHLSLPIPVYLAEDGGVVKVIIEVNRHGDVVKADPIPEAHLTGQILSYAKTAALRTRFNPDDEAPRNQQGYIQYTFVAQ